MRRWVDYAGHHRDENGCILAQVQSLPQGTGKFMPSDLKPIRNEGGMVTGHEWPPKQDRGEPKPRDLEQHPVVINMYSLYLGNGPKYNRMTITEIATILRQYGGVEGNWNVEPMLREIMLIEKARQTVRVRIVE